MKKLFLEIWNEREHVSYLTGEPLLPYGHPKWHWQFLHVLSKNHYTRWKTNKKNIILALPKEHEKQESFPKFIELRDRLKQEYFKQIYPERFKY